MIHDERSGTQRGGGLGSAEEEELTALLDLTETQCPAQPNGCSHERQAASVSSVRAYWLFPNSLWF